MNYTDQIIEFLDGELSTEQEKILFADMANNDDLRHELKEQLALKEAIKADSKAYTPLASSTVNIFSELGFSSPIGTGVIIANNSSTVASAVSNLSLSSFLAKYSQGIIGGLIAAGTTAIIMIFLMKQFGIDNNSTAINNPKSDINGNNWLYKNQSELNSRANSELPMISSNALDNSASNLSKHFSSQGKEKVIIKKIYVSSNNDKLIQNDQTSLEEEEKSLNNSNIYHELPKKIEFAFLYENENLIKDITDSFLQSSSKTQPSISFISPNPYSQLLANSVTESSGLFSIELRGTQDWFANNPSIDKDYISPSQEQIFNDYSISLLAKIAKDWEVGLDYRRENFFQKYSGIDESGILLTYEQQPNFESYGMFIRYNPDWLKMLDIVTPISQVSIAGNKAGYIMRGMCGLYFQPYNGINMIIGMEYSNLWFQHNRTTFNSPKWGLNYGISFGF